MTLRDRIRRWWSPAQWYDAHPLEAKDSKERSGWKKRRRTMYGGFDHFDGREIVSRERDFKKPR